MSASWLNLTILNTTTNFQDVILEQQIQKLEEKQNNKLSIENPYEDILIASNNDIDNFIFNEDWIQSESVQEEISRHDIILQPRINIKVAKNLLKTGVLYRLSDGHRVNEQINIGRRTKILVNQLMRHQILKRINGIVSIGTNGLLLHADELLDRLQLKEYAIRVFKEPLKFPQRRCYGRCKVEVKHWNKNPLHLWAEREIQNLYKMKSAGIPCPTVRAKTRHVIVMSFIGKDRVPAPKLKDACLSTEDLLLAYNQVVESMKALYTHTNLLPVDLSADNILWHEKTCYFIDVSRFVKPCGVASFGFLMQACTDIIEFFSQRNVPNVMAATDLFMEIAGVNYKNCYLLPRDYFVC